MVLDGIKNMSLFSSIILYTIIQSSMSNMLLEEKGKKKTADFEDRSGKPSSLVSSFQNIPS